MKCDIQFENLNIKVRHEHTRHGPPENQEECPVCHKTYQKSYLKEHITTHSESDALKCPQCGKKFSSRSNLNKHRKKHLPGYVPSSGPPREKKYCCVEEGCEKKFHSKKALEVCVISYSEIRCIAVCVWQTSRQFWVFLFRQSP